MNEQLNINFEIMNRENRKLRFDLMEAFKAIVESVDYGSIDMFSKEYKKAVNYIKENQ